MSLRCASPAGLICLVWLAWAHLATAVEVAPTNPAAWPGADLFVPGKVLQIRLEIGPEGEQSLRRDAREFVPATLWEGSTKYEKVGIHLKGSVGSFRPLDDRPALTLDFAQFMEGRKFHGLRRIHLNNSVEDPACINEALGAELFRAAGVPAPRVTRAVVTLNNHWLGLYVLKEGFTEDFLACHFKRVGGDLFEPEGGHDVDERFKRNSVQAPSLGRGPLKALAAAAVEPDLGRRWQRLQETLDTDRFISFMALEVMLGHRDGYCLARNNFRVYHDLDSGKMVFLPHGMDQLLGAADLPWQPHYSGLVARAVIETPEGRSLYAARFHSLFTNLFKVEALTNRVDQLAREVRPFLSGTNWTTLRDESEQVKARIIGRQASLSAQLSRPPVTLLVFTNGIGRPGGWRAVEGAPAARFEEARSPDGRPSLHIVARNETAASWRAQVALRPGRYRFEGRCRVVGVMPLPYGVHQGGGLRVGGRVRQAENLIGDSAWRVLGEDFQIDRDGEEVELICELRARLGEAWFELESLRIVQRP